MPKVVAVVLLALLLGSVAASVQAPPRAMRLLQQEAQALRQGLHGATTKLSSVQADGFIRHAFSFRSSLGHETTLDYQVKPRSGLRILGVDIASAQSAHCVIGQNRIVVQVAPDSKDVDALLHATHLAGDGAFTCSSADGEKNPIMHKIRSARVISAGTVEIDAEPCALHEAFESGRIEFHADSIMELAATNSASDNIVDKDFEIKLASWNYNSASRSSSGPINLYHSAITKAFSTFSLDCTDCYYYFGAGLSLVVQWPTWSHVIFDLTGRLNGAINFDVQATLTSSYSQSKDAIKLANLKVLKGLPLFTIAAIPIYLSADLDIKAGFSVSFNGKTTASTGFDAGFTYSRGIHFDTAVEKKLTPTHSSTLTKNFHPFKWSSTASGSASVYVTPKLVFSITAIGHAAIQTSPTVSVNADWKSGQSCISYDSSLRIPSSVSAQAELGKPFTLWKSKEYSWDLPSLGPYPLKSGCLPVTRALPATETLDPLPSVEEVVTQDEPCQTCINQKIAVGEEVTVDTCTLEPVDVPLHCGEFDSNTTSAYVWTVSIDLTPGKYVVDSSKSSFPALIQMHRDDCCGSFAGCSFSKEQGQTIETIAIDTPTTLVIQVSGAKSDVCGSMSLVVRPSRDLEVYVDCHNDKGDDLNDGTFAAPVRTLERAFEQISSLWASTSETQASIFLLPGACLHMVPPEGLQIPASIKGKGKLVISSINKLPATWLFDSSLNICSDDQADDQLDDDCYSKEQINAMVYGTAYDTVVSCAGSCRAFTFENDDVVLQGIGFETAGLSISQSTVSIANSLFARCRSTANGGCLHIDNLSKVTVVGTVGHFSSASGSGGFAAVLDGSSLTVHQSDLRNNEAFSGNGGAIYVAGTGSKLTVETSNLEDNVARGNGGAISVESSATSATIVSSQFSFNSATRRGGAVAVTSGATTMAANHFVSNMAGIEAGALMVLGADVSVSDESSTFTLNAAPAIVVRNKAEVSLSGSMILRNGVGAPAEHKDVPKAGAIMCSQASLTTKNTDIYGSTDEYGAPTSNIACDDCTGSCVSCGVCEGCGRCLANGCSAGTMSTFCVDRFGLNSSCSASTGMCVFEVDPQLELRLENAFLKTISIVAVAGAGTTLVISFFTIIAIIVGSALIVRRARNNAKNSLHFAHAKLQEPLNAE